MMSNAVYAYVAEAVSMIRSMAMIPFANTLQLREP